ncbi:TPA: CPBP family intramembrane metalloprotease [Pseudomonas aeruginosa]|uniref:CPBP family intramembrane glutamic endopeptidase n=2 Tax=Pseudomonas aeruginosa TaxID=287 RepID=UPI0009A936AC|nr:CPBP family intramembrane glutamic endopeptidase [Pseudomonas aeruginosa]ELK4796399.1 CPBP family intramembrane metalloprotease [Pseudomonas aeruginosa]MBG5240315.1 CPBP family intramembrane metalloprotease [Pseudomonas aeruginosa]MBG7505881.1 CPBP family intramembrane metalloprotease [Pseudomonas aeruginosa]MBH3767379.1 CPBP family intramembrane metalloprotease [Pseudomonas aeruginosa]MWW04599.1 CPBP family intramembrane metalloprotease [Pseudomonas aeruginosa]
MAIIENTGNAWRPSRSILLFSLFTIWILIFIFHREIGARMGISEVTDIQRSTGLTIAALAISALAHVSKLSSIKLHSRHGGTVLTWVAFPVFTVLLWLFYQAVIAVFPIPPEPGMDGAKEALLAGWPAAFMMVLSACLMAPINEELIFRQILADVFWGTGTRTQLFVAWLISSSVFAFAHLQYEQPLTFAWIFGLGTVCFMARVTSGGIALPILLHIICNALACASIYWALL